MRGGAKVHFASGQLSRSGCIETFMIKRPFMRKSHEISALRIKPIPISCTSLAFTSQLLSVQSNVLVILKPNCTFIKVIIFPLKFESSVAVVEG